MIRKFLFGVLSLLLFSNVLLAQSKDSIASGKINQAENKETIYAHVKQMPEFRSGKDGLEKYLLTKTQYPEEAKKKGIRGSVPVRFIVDKKGKIQDAKVMKSLGYGCDEEALRVIREMPNWKAGREGKKTVSAFVNVSVSFPADLKTKGKALPPSEIGNETKSESQPMSKTEALPSNKLGADSAFFNKGMEQLKKMDYNSAAASFSEALKINPSNAKALLFRGSAYYKLKDLDKACNDWGRSVELGDKDAVNMTRKYCKR
jgi:TonB family protein